MTLCHQPRSSYAVGQEQVARPVNANAEETRGRILEAASELFAQRGFEGASVRQIATGAGVSLGMIRHYYGSKDGLYRACIATAYAIYQQLGSQIDDALSAGGSPANVLESAVRTAFRYALAHRPAFKLTLWSLLGADSYPGELGDSEMLPFIQRLADHLAGPLSMPRGNVALKIRTMIFLVSRYATADYDEMAELIGQAPDEAQTVQALEDHLADATRRLFA